MIGQYDYFYVEYTAAQKGFLQVQYNGLSFLLTDDFSKAYKPKTIEEAREALKKMLQHRPDIAYHNRWTIIGIRTTITKTRYEAWEE